MIECPIMKKKRRIRPFFRFLILLSAAFLAIILLFKGGIIAQDVPVPRSGILDGMKNSSVIAAGIPAREELSFPDRIRRLLFLRSEVEKLKLRENYTDISDIPISLRQAVIAVEDSRFLSHHGFDIEAIIRASLVNLQYGQIEEGASTITQQLVKNLFLSQERSFSRKVEELFLALSMEFNFSKEDILEFYLNSIYFGSGYYGIHDAAMGYFGKSPKELELSEAAMLAGLPNAPSLYSPYVDFIMAKKRQFVVLDAMYRTGFITKEQSEDAKIAPIYLAHE